MSSMEISAKPLNEKIAYRNEPPHTSVLREKEVGGHLTQMFSGLKEGKVHMLPVSPKSVFPGDLWK